MRFQKFRKSHKNQKFSKSKMKKTSELIDDLSNRQKLNDRVQLSCSTGNC